MDRAAAPTVMLTERTALECVLSADDVAFLHDQHRAHVQLTPAGVAGFYRLTPTGHVGTIVGPACRLVIRPKIPLPNLFQLLDPLAAIDVTEDHTAAETGTELLDFLAGRLARLLEERAAAGLHRAYAETMAVGPFLQGRLDVPAQIRGGGVRKDRFHSCYEDFTADVPCNQVPKATAELVLRSPALGDAVRSRLRQALAAFACVSPVPLNIEQFQTAGADRLTQAYRAILDLCALLFQGLGPGATAGALACPAFLLDMERVFERYVTRGVEEACAGSGLNVAVQARLIANRPAAGQPDIHLRPDLVVERDARPVAVADAKWKRGKGPPLLPADLYQVIAYAAALGVHRAVLVYPGRRDRAWRYELARAPIGVEIRTLNVCGTRGQCRRSLVRLGRSIVSRGAASAG